MPAGGKKQPGPLRVIGGAEETRVEVSANPLPSHLGFARLSRSYMN
jgi:hypothetical protein